MNNGTRRANISASARQVGLLQGFVEEAWYGKHPAAVALIPFGWLYRTVVALRRLAFNNGLLRVYEATVPVIVVGNLTVGGVGKTPLVIWLTGFLSSIGMRPGIVSRGYGGRVKRRPQQVRPDSDPRTVGDEAIIVARRTRCPMAVGKDRGACVEALLDHADCNVVVCDDGLQHYALARNIEVLVVDGIRRFGNGRCLPAGPLREPLSRAREVDMTVSNGLARRGEFSMKYLASDAYPVGHIDAPQELSRFPQKHVHAIAGIGNPEHFFSMLRSKGLRVKAHPFPDHHPFTSADLNFSDNLPILMTEKDAVKIEPFANERHWFVPITAELPAAFGHRLQQLLKRDSDG